MPQGYIFDTEDIARNLQEANRTYEGRKTWEEMYGAINVSEQKAIGSLQQDYASAIGQAYTSSLQNEQNIITSNIGQGYKQQALLENELALEEAFKSYQENYLQNVQTVSESATKATSEVTSLLKQQAEYTKQMAEAPYKYLEYMYENYGNTDLFKEDLWKRYLTDKGDLKSWEAIANAGAKDEAGQYIGLFDDEGNLTIKGIDFYDQMMNQMSYEHKGESFYSWLSKENEELFNWSKSYNPYDYTEAGTQAGSFRTMVGLTSTDEQYRFIERFGGMSESEVKKSFDKFKKVINDGDSNYKENIEVLKDLTNEVKNFATELGIEEEFAKEIGGWDNFVNTLDNYKNNIKDNLFEDIGSSTLGFLENAGNFVLNIFRKDDVAMRDKSRYDEYNQNKAKEAEQLYLNMVNSLINYAQQKQRQNK